MDNEYEQLIKDIFAMYHEGHHDIMRLMADLDLARFDGDIVDYL